MIELLRIKNKELLVKDIHIILKQLRKIKVILLQKLLFSCQNTKIVTQRYTNYSSRKKKRNLYQHREYLVSKL